MPRSHRTERTHSSSWRGSHFKSSAVPIPTQKKALAWSCATCSACSSPPPPAASPPGSRPAPGRRSRAPPCAAPWPTGFFFRDCSASIAVAVRSHQVRSGGSPNAEAHREMFLRNQNVVVAATSSPICASPLGQKQKQKRTSATALSRALISACAKYWSSCATRR